MLLFISCRKITGIKKNYTKSIVILVLKYNELAIEKNWN